MSNLLKKAATFYTSPWIEGDYQYCKDDTGSLWRRRIRITRKQGLRFDSWEVVKHGKK